MGTKISGLSAATTLDGTEPVALVQGGITKKATLSLVSSQNALGSAAAPSIAFTGGAGYTDKGLYSDGANTIAFAIGGARKVQVHSSGLQLLGGANAINSGTANTGLILDGNISTTNADSLQLRNNGLVFTGAAGIVQRSVAILAGINQTSTASFVGLAIMLGLAAAGTGTPVFGSGGGLFLDFQSNSVSIASMSAAGALAAGLGSQTLPSLTFTGLTDKGFYSDSPNTVAFSASGSRRLQFYASGIQLFSGCGLNMNSANNGINIQGNTTNVAAASIDLNNAGAFAGGAGIFQIGARIYSGINQTSTASFTSLVIDQGLVQAGTGTPVFGSGGGKFLDFRSNSVSIASMSAVGALLAGAGTNTLPGYGFAAEPSTGIYWISSGTLGLTSVGTLRWNISSSMNSQADGQVIRCAATNGRLVLGGTHTTGADAPILITNSNAFTGSSGSQNGLLITAGSNQTSTASFAGLQINLGLVAAGTGVPVYGSGGGKFLDLYANSVRMAAITAAGAFLGTGSQSLPHFADATNTATGMYIGASTTVDFSVAGTHTWTMKASSVLEGHGNTGLEPTISCGVANSGAVRLLGWVSTATTPTSKMANQVVFSASSGAQLGTQLVYGVSQTSTASFTALSINLGNVIGGTGAPVYGSGGGLFLDCQSNSARQFSVSDQGGTASTAVSPGALAVTANDSTALGQSGFARLTGNASNTAITGFLATNVPDGRMVVVVNIGAPTITLNHQNAGSAAANRIITATGANVVLAQDDSVVLVYDLTTQRWRQITTLA